jgi:Protein of unknown function (DUF3662)/FHA domain
MPTLRDFERRLEGLVEGFFAKAFRSGLQPVELGKRLLREMDSNQTIGVQDVWVPNHYVFRLAAEDHARLEGAEHRLASELQQLVRDGAAERGWKLVGPPEVSFEVDEELGRGEFRCDSSIVEGPDRPLTGEMEAVGTALLYLIHDGEPAATYPLDKPVVSIGRLSDCDVVVSDPGASRHHAEIRAQDGHYVLADLGSTNGTKVNEATVGERELQSGDRITIGRTVLEFRRA